MANWLYSITLTTLSLMLKAFNIVCLRALFQFIFSFNANFSFCLVKSLFNFTFIYFNCIWVYFVSCSAHVHTVVTGALRIIIDDDDGDDIMMMMLCLTPNL